jgi:hypothetical protein
MPKLGAADVDAVYLGGSVVDKLYLGSNAVYTAVSPPDAPTNVAITVEDDFAPSDITGLQLWLDASDASTLYDATTGGSLVAADGGVARWEDKSGNARHMTQGTAGSRPARKTSIQGGLDVLRFDGSNDFLSVPSSTATFKFLHDATGGIVFAVYKANAAQGTAYVWCNNTNPSTASVASQTGVYYRHDTSDLAVADRYAVISNTSSGFRMVRASAANTVESGTFLLIAVQYDMNQGSAADRHDAFLNGSEITGTDTLGVGENSSLSTSAATGDLHIFANNNAVNKMAGDLCEMIIYEGKMSTADRQSVENYLLGKWGIS